MKEYNFWKNMWLEFLFKMDRLRVHLAKRFWDLRKYTPNQQPKMNCFLFTEIINALFMIKSLSKPDYWFWRVPSSSNLNQKLKEYGLEITGKKFIVFQQDNARRKLHDLLVLIPLITNVFFLYRAHCKEKPLNISMV